MKLHTKNVLFLWCIVDTLQNPIPATIHSVIHSVESFARQNRTHYFKAWYRVMIGNCIRHGRMGVHPLTFLTRRGESKSFLY
jgi:hypothetical protein